LPSDRFDLASLDRWLAAVLIGERVIVSLCDEATFCLFDDAVGRQSPTLDLLRAKRDYITLLDIPCYGRWNRHETVPGSKCRLHAPTYNESDKNRLSDYLPDDDCDNA
jgi:hypothetical protein